MLMQKTPKVHLPILWLAPCIVFHSSWFTKIQGFVSIYQMSIENLFPLCIYLTPWPGCAPPYCHSGLIMIIASLRPSKGFERQVRLRQNVATICYQSSNSRKKLTWKGRQFAKRTIYFSFWQSDNCTFFLRWRHDCHESSHIYSSKLVR